MRKIFILGLALCVACGRGESAGKQASETRSVDRFDQIELSGVGTLYVEQGSEPLLKVVAGEKLLSMVESEVSDGRLKISVQPEAFLENVEMHVTVPKLTEVKITGDASIYIREPLQFEKFALELNGTGRGELNLQGEEFELTVNGHANIEAIGKVEEQELVIKGGGQFEGPNFEGEEVSVRIMGSGNVAVAPTKRLKVRILGGGEVYYTGNPDVSQRIIGGGQVAPLKERLRPDQPETSEQSSDPAPQDAAPTPNRDRAEPQAA